MKARALGAFALLFGVVTILYGGRTLSLPPELRPDGVVLWVLGFNTVAGFFYVAAGLGILLQREWAEALAWALGGCTALVALGFGIHVLDGGSFMPRTVAALLFRGGFWLAVALSLGRWRRST